jgi:BirA family biotin operon repressor/biotin-[acetyl-CoA-carboxylase] ligase
LAAEGAAGLTVVWAQEQTAGRGRHGRSWDSPRGNLYISILLRPDCDIADAPQIGFAVGAAMTRAVRAIAGADVELKWPNDLLLGGAKLSGILLESAARADGRLDWVVAGIGVNVDSQPEVPGATCLLAAGYDITAEALLEEFLPNLVELLGIWERDGFGPIRAIWSALALALDTELTVKLPDGVKAGTFSGIDESGNLLLSTDTGTERIAVGDVFPVSTVSRDDGAGAN